MAFKFEIFKKDGQYRIRLVSGSGDTVITSGTYPSKADAKDGI